MRSGIRCLCWFACFWLLLQVYPSDAASRQAEAAAPVSPLATPNSDTPVVSPAGTVPTKTVTATVALPLVTSQLPQFLPLVRWEEPQNLPAQPYPPNGAEGQSLNVYLAWQLDHPRGAVRVELLLDANDPTPQTVIYQGAPPALGIDPTTFELETQYYWQVITISEQGLRVAGPIWRFQTEGAPAMPDRNAMVSIPAGEFRMGCDGSINPAGGCFRNNTPLHAVYLDAYEIDKYEVTNGEYRACVDAGVCGRPRRYNSYKRGEYFWEDAFAYFPVLYVSWWDAQTFCAWEGKRLPTEAEWEKAARGPIDTRTWPWGEEFPDCSRLNFTNNTAEEWIICADDTTQVGSYPRGASPYGVMDVSGNVFEWVGDLWDDHYEINYYAISPYENPTGPDLSREPSDNPYFTMRGGSYRPNWYYPRTFYRHHGHHGDTVGGDRPWYRNNQVGFRCARPLP
jgi:formylglycine-generating enzyme